LWRRGGNRWVVSKLLEKLNAEFYRERERVEDLNIFLGFMFTGIHSSELKMLKRLMIIYYVTNTWYVKFM
jgi:hypothetical protein